VVELAALFLAYPAEANAGDGAREHVSDDGRVAAGGGEICVELGVLPVGHARHDDALQVGHQRRPPLALLGRRLGQQRPDVARLHLGQHAP
jgi:hypothetical protein